MCIRDREELMEHVWDNSVDSFSNSIRVHISALRKKLRAALGFDPVSYTHLDVYKRQVSDKPERRVKLYVRYRKTGRTRPAAGTEKHPPKAAARNILSLIHI